ncbi:MAG: GyrI-like domain-containing protein [Clostridiaceae bacterium]
MKYEWKKMDKEIYLPAQKPQMIEVPEYKYFLISGEGNPNADDFAESVQALYSLSYSVKMMPKKGKTPEGYYDYTVFPLEGFWDLKEEKRTMGKFNKNDLVYTIMIRQPDFVDDALANEVIETVKKTKPQRFLDKVTFGPFDEGLSLQIMHVGPYDEEPKTFRILDDYCLKNRLIRKSKTHKEIYISDVRRVEPNKMKTVLRIQVEKID